MEDRHSEDCVCGATGFQHRQLLGILSGDTVAVSDEDGKAFSIRIAHISGDGRPISCGLPLTVYLEVPCRRYQPTKVGKVTP